MPPWAVIAAVAWCPGNAWQADRRVLAAEARAKRHSEPEPFGPLPCTSPVARAPVEFPQDLVAGTAADGLSMASGYVNVTSTDYLFYWFVEAADAAPKDAPVLLWSNGGPGCSGMEGATTELGALVLYHVKESGGTLFGGKLTRNPYSWHQRAHLLFVDQPRYVGFSCGTGRRVTSSREAAQDIVVFLQGWRRLFPELGKNRSFVFASESYGGKFVPLWLDAVMEHNKREPSEKIAVVGALLGNALVNETYQDDASFIQFQRQQGLLPLDSSPSNEYGARKAMASFLGYEPNFYDYRLRDMGYCCGCFGYDYTAWSKWLLRKDVLEALHVCGDAGNKAFSDCAGGCIGMPSFRHNDRSSGLDFSGALGRALASGVGVTFFHGEQDTACNAVGAYTMVKHLDFPGAQEFAAAPLEQFHVGGATAGLVQSAGGLTWIQIRGAGHMSPADNPAAAFLALDSLLEPSRLRRAVEQGNRTLSFLAKAVV